MSSPLDSSAALLLTVVLSHINIKTFNTIEVAPGSPPFIIAAIAFDKAEGEDDEGQYHIYRVRGEVVKPFNPNMGMRRWVKEQKLLKDEVS